MENYKIIKPLGQGTFGVVQMGQHKITGRTVGQYQFITLVTWYEKYLQLSVNCLYFFVPFKESKLICSISWSNNFHIIIQQTP